MEHVTLMTIGNGTAHRLFDKELRAVMRNIADEMTPAKEARKITLEVTILPTIDRAMGMVEMKAYSKLAKVGGPDELVYFTDNGFGLEAMRDDPKQDGFAFSSPASDETAPAEEPVEAA